MVRNIKHFSFIDGPLEDSDDLLLDQRPEQDDSHPETHYVVMLLKLLEIMERRSQIREQADKDGM